MMSTVLVLESVHLAYDDALVILTLPGVERPTALLLACKVKQDNWLRHIDLSAQLTMEITNWLDF
jgi:hypothetical protein